MANMQEQIQMHEIRSDGTVYDLMPVTTSLDVQVGQKSNGSLTLPGSTKAETLSETLSNIRKYLYNLTDAAQETRKISSDKKDASTINIPTTEVTTELSNEIDSAGERLDTIEDIIKNGVAPTLHADETLKYGGATGTLYGHVKLSDDYSSKTTNGSASYSIGASQNALYNAWANLEEAKAPNIHSSGDSSTYGAASSTLYGHVKTNSSASNASTDDAEVPSQASIKSLYDTVVSNKSATDTALSGKAPTSHASSDTTYGVGSSTNYGHLKVNDNYNDSSQESGGKAANAVSASSWAVKRCYDALKSICDGKLASGHADEKATASKYSHVMLSDAYTSSGGAASAGVGASSKAVYDSYTALNKSISTINTTISTMQTNFQAGVDKIYNACKTYGSTPSASTPDACVTSIKTIYTDRYNSGYSDGNSAGYSSGYSAGKSATSELLKMSKGAYSHTTSSSETVSITGSTGDYVACICYAGRESVITLSVTNATRVMNVPNTTYATSEAFLSVWKVTSSGTITASKSGGGNYGRHYLSICKITNGSALSGLSKYGDPVIVTAPSAGTIVTVEAGVKLILANAYSESYYNEYITGLSNLVSITAFQAMFDSQYYTRGFVVIDTSKESTFAIYCVGNYNENKVAYQFYK